MDGWLGGSFMYVFHTNQIWDSTKDQSNCGLYIWIVFMNICFGFKVRPSFATDSTLLGRVGLKFLFQVLIFM